MALNIFKNLLKSNPSLIIRLFFFATTCPNQPCAHVWLLTPYFLLPLRLARDLRSLHKYRPGEYKCWSELFQALPVCGKFWSRFAWIPLKMREMWSCDSQEIIEIVATRGHIFRLKCTKFHFGWGSAPDPNGGAYSAPQTP